MITSKTVTSVLNKHKKRDTWFLDDYSVNPYEGCSCNCQYCYIRGSKYGVNMAEKLSVKTNALEVLEKQLASRAKKNQFGFVAVGSATDAYMPHENEFQLTREFLKLLLKYRFPVFISTKCALILRDVDLLKQIEQAAILPEDLRNRMSNKVIVSVSLSTLENDLAETLEPGALLPMERLNVLRQLKQSGLLCGVNAIPLLPFISDTDESLEQLIGQVKAHGAHYILAGGLTLFGDLEADSKTLYYKFISRKFPHLISDYKKLYNNKFHTPFWYQEELKQRVAKLCTKFHLRNSILQ